MQRAIALAQSVLSAGPNPRVGCVVVRDGQVVGEGFHQKPGEPHAEAVALSEAGDRARGATAYVSLEPCAHMGRTPPCSDALIQAGIAEVVYAGSDPNPQVSGQGLQRLREAGIRVRGPVLADEADALNRGFLKRMTQGLPWVRCKMAMSLDGRTAMASGESKWITGAAARADVQLMRASSCAVVTGVNTVLSDNPSLNVRPDQVSEAHAALIGERQPMRVVLDSSLRTPPDSRLIDLPGDILFLTGQPHPQQRARYRGSRAGIREIAVQPGGRLDLRAAMACLALDYECNEVMLEAGPTLSGAMVQAGLVDEVVIYIGARFLGSDALPLFHLPGINRMQDHIGLEITGVRQIADDCCITARLRRVL
ncbi:MAG: bifunctional diaminohydroxyphosphoribosylaminopyrimidine deaminase/5-amino-6-(5-phosphoribosylamino)uracil reductase RibD [Pseudohongiella sp.]|uniref:bifunctional diaminohydroxyphosphoribosylaminopyrimidine deaminase/5-amino-6-(5-phosphoribosylamino)uracil reductase RibD n=1 Tax=Pseudohongiella sp. TaxID=1979412 RepID=UPI0034A0AB9D